MSNIWSAFPTVFSTNILHNQAVVRITSPSSHSLGAWVEFFTTSASYSSKICRSTPSRSSCVSSRQYAPRNREPRFDHREAEGHNGEDTGNNADPQKAIKMHVDEEEKLTRQIVVSDQRSNVWLPPSATPSSATKAACRSTPSRSLVH